MTPQINVCDSVPMGIIINAMLPCRLYSSEGAPVLTPRHVKHKPMIIPAIKCALRLIVLEKWTSPIFHKPMIGGSPHSKVCGDTFWSGWSNIAVPRVKKGIAKHGKLDPAIKVNILGGLLRNVMFIGVSFNRDC